MKSQNVFSESLKNQNKNLVVNLGDSEFVNLVVRWREQDIGFDFWKLINIREINGENMWWTDQMFTVPKELLS